MMNISGKAKIFKLEEVATQTGTVMVNLKLSSGRKRKNSEEWDNCNLRAVAFGITADIIKNQLQEGDYVYFVGLLQDNNYEKEGQKFYGHKMIINEIHKLSNDPRPENINYNPVANPPPAVEVSDDDLPF